MNTVQKDIKTTKTEIELFVINKVKELREAANISQRNLSIELNLSASYIGKVESLSTREKYNFNHINEIARFFDVPYSYFFPQTHLERDCIEEYWEKHPVQRAQNLALQMKEEEKALKKAEERKMIKKEKAATKAKTKKK